MTNQNAPKKLSLRQILSSTLAAAFGVQSSGNLKRDFSAGRPSSFILAGIVFTFLFVLSIIALVHWIL
ncbi:MAG: DUF2970 domain-containing protein [Gammaproteobacteria bacterium]